jgi:energy-coupling factor transporter ATP-binding protein EcfA2
MMNRYEEVEKYGKSGSGKKELLKHLSGLPLIRSQAIKAACYQCMGYFLDGRIDCKITSCPLYPFMPYGTGAGKKKLARLMAREARIEASGQPISRKTTKASKGGKNGGN